MFSGSAPTVVSQLRRLLTYDLRASRLGPDNLPIGTFRRPTVTIDADDFSAENMTFENAAGPVGQALAIRVDGDRAVFRNCRFVGWQDTVFVNRGRQYFEDSLITGHVDFASGDPGYITAASTPQEAPHGFVFANGAITGEPDAGTYLGRPWRDFAAVAFLNMDMSDAVRPAGWHNWDKPERERTSRYAEFGSRGSGGRLGERVAWARRLSAREARELSATNVLRGPDGWNPLALPSHPSSSRAVDPPLPRAPGL